jgi:hypothetical protein
MDGSGFSLNSLGLRSKTDADAVDSESVATRKTKGGFALGERDMREFEPSLS